MFKIQRVKGGEFAHEIYGMHDECFGKAAALCDVNVGHWWVALDEDEPVGFAALVARAQVPDAGYMVRAGVMPVARGNNLQRRMINARLQYARRLGWNHVVTDTFDNIHSANNLIACGFRLYNPINPWSFKGALYFKRNFFAGRTNDNV